jgi:CRISPR-associated protein Csm1
MKNYFLKCDISGIQSFIFNVPGKGAAKELKNRSVYVQNITNDCLKKITDFLEISNDKNLLYNGGGNFYLKVETEKNEKELSDFIANLCEEYKPQDIFPYIAFVENEGQSLLKLFDAINKKIQRAKLQRPFSYETLDAKQLPVPDKGNIIKGINGQVPKDENGQILDFDKIVKFSKGDEKLAALKLDVDNLGQLFRDGKEDDYKKLSDALKNFFDEKLLKLIEKNGMNRHVYTVFSGGDDCFLIGCWDRIFELAIAMRNEFQTFQEQLKNEIKSLPKDEITFSAGIIVVHPKYPVIRLSEDVEEALSASKRAEGKNSVTVFGKTLAWKDFGKSKKISDQLFDLIENRDEPKNLITRIKSSDIGFDALQRNASDGKIHLPKVWRLKYYLRNVQKHNEKEIGELFDEYTKAVLDTFMKRQTTNPDLYPVAARWAELLLKKNKYDNQL